VSVVLSVRTTFFDEISINQYIVMFLSEQCLCNQDKKSKQIWCASYSH